MSAASNRQVNDLADLFVTFPGLGRSARQGQTLTVSDGSTVRIVADFRDMVACADVNDIGLSVTYWFVSADDATRADGITPERRDAAVRRSRGLAGGQVERTERPAS